MTWLNLEIRMLRSPEFLGSEPVDRATWLALMTFCAIQENGGWIPYCEEWGERKWQQLVGVTKEEAMRECVLWKWDTGHILLWGYPRDKEHEVRGNRLAGKIGGSKVSEAKAAAARQNGARGGRPPEDEKPAEPKQETQAEPKRNPIENPTEGKGREGKGIERKEEPAASPVVFSESGRLPEQAEKLRALHAEFERMTGQKCALNYQRESTWAEFARRGFTAADLSQVVRWLKLKIGRGEGGYSEASLKFSTLLHDLNKFEDNLNVARKAKLPPERSNSALREPPGWQAWSKGKWPACILPATFWGLDESVQREFREAHPAMGWKGGNYIGV